MKNELFLFDAIGLINDSFIEEAAPTSKTKKATEFWSRWGAAAACLLMLALINVVFIYFYKWDGNPSDTKDPAATDTDTDFDWRDQVYEPELKYEIYAYNNPTVYARIHWISPEAEKAVVKESLEYYRPKAFIYSQMTDKYPFVKYFLKSRMPGTKILYTPMKEMSESDKIKTVTFMGETYDVTYLYAKKIGRNEGDASPYDSYAAYIYQTDDGRKEFYVRPDGVVTGYKDIVNWKSPEYDVETGKSIAAQLLYDILGDASYDYELKYYSATTSSNSHYAEFYRIIDGIKTEECIYMNIVGNGVLAEFGAEDLGRFEKYENLIDSETVDKYMTYLRDRLESLGISLGRIVEEGKIVSDDIRGPVLAEYGNELFITCMMEPAQGIDMGDEISTMIWNGTDFFIKVNREDYADVKVPAVEDDTVKESITVTDAEIVAFTEPCLHVTIDPETGERIPDPTINTLYPDDFLKGDLYMSYYLSYRLSMIRCDKALDKNVAEKKENITFCGDTYKVVYSASYGYRGTADEAYESSVYDFYDEYAVHSGGMMRLRSDGVIVMLTTGTDMAKCSFNAKEGREIADGHLSSILGTKAIEYELISESHTDSLYSAYYSYTIDGVHTMDVVNIIITGEGELYEYSAYDLGRFAEYKGTVTKERVDAYMSYAREKLDALGLPGSELSAPMVGEYSGELYVITGLDELLGREIKTHFHIRIEK